MSVLPTEGSRRKWVEIADRLSAATVDEVL
jgi:hypothetical protein